MKAESPEEYELAYLPLIVCAAVCELVAIWLNRHAHQRLLFIVPVLQAYFRCVEKKDKYSGRERTGPNVVKLEQVRRHLIFAGDG